MKITIDIPAPIYRKLRAVAAARGCSMKDLLVRSAMKEIDDGAKKNRKKVIKLPIIDSRRPGWLRLTNRRINELC